MSYYNKIILIVWLIMISYDGLRILMMA